MYNILKKFYFVKFKTTEEAVFVLSLKTFDTNSAVLFTMNGSFDADLLYVIK
jgi:hypothetical protein